MLADDMQQPTNGAASNPLVGKRILLTGGTTGIGRATLIALAGAGAKLVTFGRDGDALRDALAAASLAEDAGLTADIAKASEVERVFGHVDRTMGGIDALIACAALGAQPIHEMAEEEWRYVVETNLVGTMSATRAAILRMMDQGWGQIVLVSSISPEIKAPGESVYAATKAGLDAFALTLRKELSGSDIRITLIQPGSTATDMQECTVEEKRAAVSRGEMLHADEIAEAILFSLTRSDRCDVVSLRIEPVRQKTA